MFCIKSNFSRKKNHIDQIVEYRVGLREDRFRVPWQERSPVKSAYEALPLRLPALDLLRSVAAAIQTQRAFVSFPISCLQFDFRQARGYKWKQLLSAGKLGTIGLSEYCPRPFGSNPSVAELIRQRYIHT